MLEWNLIHMGVCVGGESTTELHLNPSVGDSWQTHSKLTYEGHWSQAFRQN